MYAIHCAFNLARTQIITSKKKIFKKESFSLIATLWCRLWRYTQCWKGFIVNNNVNDEHGPHDTTQMWGILFFYNPK